MATTVPAAFTELQGRLALTPNQRTIAAGRLANLQTFFAANYLVATAPWARGGQKPRFTTVRILECADAVPPRLGRSGALPSPRQPS